MNRHTSNMAPYDRFLIALEIGRTEIRPFEIISNSKVT